MTPEEQAAYRAIPSLKCTAVSIVSTPAGFFWFHRRDAGRPDHVISLCSGHAYLTKKGRWQPGSGDMPDLLPATGCCVCRGFPPTARMRNAPLIPHA